MPKEGSQQYAAALLEQHLGSSHTEDQETPLPGVLIPHLCPVIPSSVQAGQDLKPWVSLNLFPLPKQRTNPASSAAISPSCLSSGLMPCTLQVADAARCFG